MKIVSLNIGQPHVIQDQNGDSFVSGIRKLPTENEVFLAFGGVTGDASFEDCHGTINMALHVFCYNHYGFFNNKIGGELPVPAFGENLTVSGLLEQNTNVGDILAIGDAVVQVSQPTERCKTIGRSLGYPQMLKWIHEQMMTGFYLRVLEEGTISCRSDIRMIERGPAELNLAVLNQLLFKDQSLTSMEKVLEHDVISIEWKTRARKLYGRAGLQLYQAV